jgi:hypothetical protein
MISKAPKMAISSQFSESEIPSRALLDNFNNNKKELLEGKSVRKGIIFLHNSL